MRAIDRWLSVSEYIFEKKLGREAEVAIETCPSRRYQR